MPGLNVPPMLEIALGCSSAHRYILFFKSLEGNAAWTDGRRAMSLYWPTWLLYSNSPSTLPFFRFHALQSLNREMSRGLVLDRTKRRFSIDDAVSISRRLNVSRGELFELKIEPCAQPLLAMEMTQHIAKHLY